MALVDGGYVACTPVPVTCMGAKAKAETVDELGSAFATCGLLFVILDHFLMCSNQYTYLFYHFLRLKR